MTFWDVVLKVLVGVALCAFLALIGYLCYKLVRLSIHGKVFLSFIEKKLYGWTEPKVQRITKSIDRKTDAVLLGPTFRRIAQRHPAFGSAKTLRIALLSLVFILATFIYYLFAGGPAQFLTEFVGSFPMFVLFDGGIHKFINSLSLVSVISVGISATLIGRVFKNLTGELMLDNIIDWLVSFLYYIISALAGCFMGSFLQNVWEFVADMGVSAFNTTKNILVNSDFSLPGILKILLCIIGIAIIVYVGLKILLVALKEYIDLICFGVASFAVVLGTALALKVIFGDETLLIVEIILTVVFFVTLAVSDYIRVLLGRLFDEEE